MWAVITLFFLVLAQNASFTLVSRARNSKSLLYHGLAAIGSNGIWLLLFKNMVVSINVPILMWTYLVASVLGSIGMHYIAMKFFEKPKQAPVQKPSIGRIVNYNLHGMKLPAIIVAANEDATGQIPSVNLEVFGLSEKQKILGVSQGNTAGTWNWPVIK